MRRFNVFILGLVAAALILSACGSPAVTGPSPAAPSGPTPAATAKPAWQSDWEATLAAARKEGEVTVYTTYGPEWRQAMSQVMLAKYGLTFNVISGRSDELIERVMREQNNKVYQADALHAVSGKRYYVDVPLFKDILPNLEKTIILPEVLDTKVWAGGQFPWVDPETKNLVFWRDYLSPPLFVNTDLVKPDEVKSWDNLLDAKWKGNIVLSDPTIAGASNLAITVVIWGIKDWSYIDKLLKQEPVIQRDYRLMSEWIARGKYPIMVGPQKGEAQGFIDAGAPVKYVNLTDGVISTFGAGTIATLKGAPHPNAAKVFINYLLTQEGQTLTAKSGGFPSARVDVPTDFLDPSTLRRPGLKVFSTDSKDYLDKVDAINVRLKQTFDPYLKK